VIEGMGAEIVEVLADPAGDIVSDHSRGDPDGVGHALGRRAPVALHDQSVEAEKDRAIMIVRVQMDLEQV
jgi:hypothetical protein